MRKGSDTHLPLESGFQTISLSGDSFEEVASHTKPEDGPMIIDTRSVDESYLYSMNKAGYRTVIFDDGKRLGHYPVDVVVDYAPGAEGIGYEGLSKTTFCLGPSFFPLRPEFRQSFDCRERFPVQSLLLTFGGSDPEDHTGRVLNTLMNNKRLWTTEVVVGPGYCGSAERLASNDPMVEIRRSVSQMSKLMNTADLAVSGAGGTALELAYMGVPSILIAVAADQSRISSGLASAGAAVDMGWHQDLSTEALCNTLFELADNPGQLSSMSRQGKIFVDGLGTDRIVQTILDSWGRL